MPVSYQNAIIIFAKEPQPGRVKTRLACQSDDTFASAFYVECLKHLFFELKTTLSSRIFAFITPESSPVYFQQYSPDRIMHQHGKDLGERMKNAFTEVFSINENCHQSKEFFKNVLLIGSDIPQLNATILNQAQHALTNNDCVLGPAHDGGYYLIGFTRAGFTDCFHGIHWSTSEVLEKTKALLTHKKTVLLPFLSDIDTLADVRHLYNSATCPPSMKAFLDQYQQLMTK